VIDKIKAGRDMSKVAYDYSENPYRIKGGNYGLIHKGRFNRDLENTIIVGVTAVEAHLRHSDTIGTCPDAPVGGKYRKESLM
jgi:hypothetical protein